MDRVEDQFILKNSRNQRLRRRVKARVISPIMRRWHHRLIARANLSLCHGGDCLNAYGKLNASSHLTHDVHIEVDPSTVERLSLRKQEQVRGEAPIEICYAGRLAAEKAPLDWVQTIGHAHSRGVRLRATWLGDGPLRAAALAMAERMGLAETIAFPGFVEDRQRVMDLVASSHAMLFTHITPESPRCLVEALMHATPIVGYDTDYSRDLIKANGGGLHVTGGDFRALGESLVGLNRDRSSLADLINRAHMDGRLFGCKEVFRVRSEPIVKYLG